MPRSHLFVFVTTAALLAAPGCSKNAPATQAPAAQCLVEAPHDLDPATKRDDIRRLLELTGAVQLAEQVADPLFDAFQKAAPQVPTEMWAKLRERIDYDELLRSIIDVYEEELSHDDIVAMIRFYESPHGSRFAKAMPTMTAKSQEIGRQYGERVAREVIAELIESGYQIQ